MIFILIYSFYNWQNWEDWRKQVEELGILMVEMDFLNGKQINKDFWGILNLFEDCTLWVFNIRSKGKEDIRVFDTSLYEEQGIIGITYYKDMDDFSVILQNCDVLCMTNGDWAWRGRVE